MGADLDACAAALELGGMEKVNESDTYCLTAGQVRAMRDHTGENSELVWLHSIIVALSTSGMRIGNSSGYSGRTLILQEG